MFQHVIVTYSNAKNLTIRRVRSVKGQNTKYTSFYAYINFNITVDLHNSSNIRVL